MIDGFVLRSDKTAMDYVCVLILALISRLQVDNKTIGIVLATLP